jgi:enoyl-CoA hydratase/carnithine racemase
MAKEIQMQTSSGCAVTLDSRVLEIAIDRPEQRNALNYNTVGELIAALREADADDDVGAVLLYGVGSCFCAGADLAEFDQSLGQSALAYHDTGELWAELMTTAPRLGVPVVIAAHRYALAGAVGLVSSGDVVLAAEGTKFGLPEIRIGLFPAIVLRVVAEAIGPSAARELALTGRRFDATEALRLGLVHRVVAPENLLDEARTVARELAGFGKDVNRLGKELLRHILALSVDDGVAYGKAMRGAFMETEAFRQGVARFTSGAGS